MTKQEFLAMSLPYGLKCYIAESEIYTYLGTFYQQDEENNYEDVKPILHPLSDLTKVIEHKGEMFVPIYWLEEKYYTLDLYKQAIRLAEDSRWVNQSDFMLINQLIEWHFDIAGLIEKGEAIDVNTLSENPYK